MVSHAAPPSGRIGRCILSRRPKNIAGRNRVTILSDSSRPSQPRRVRVAVVGASPCGQCHAACCRQSVSEFAVLLQTESERRRFASWSVDLPVRDGERVVAERVIPYRSGRCPFLSEDDRCTIYEDRPQSCRDFECTRHFNQAGRIEHGLFLQGNPRVAGMLTRV